MLIFLSLQKQAQPIFLATHRYCESKRQSPLTDCLCFSNYGQSFYYQVWEEKIKDQLFDLMCKVDGLWSFAGSLWSFASSLQSFSGSLGSFAGGLWQFVVICGRLLVAYDRFCSFVVVACFSDYVFVSGIPISYSSVTTKFFYY